MAYYWIFIKNACQKHYIWVETKLKEMLTTRIRKFAELYGQFAYEAVKNLWLLVNLITVSRSVNLNKIVNFTPN